MRNTRVTRPSVEVGYSSASGAITTDGQTWGDSPRVAGAAFAANTSVVAMRSGRKLIGVGTGGLYSARTTH